MNTRHILPLLVTVLLISLPAASARADGGTRRTQRVDPLKHKQLREHNRRGSRNRGVSTSVRSRRGMVAKVRSWQRKNWRAKKENNKYGSQARWTVKRRSARSSYVWHKRSYKTPRSRAQTRIRYRSAGRKLGRSTIATLIRAGVLRRGTSGKLFVLSTRGTHKVKKGTRRHHVRKQFHLFRGKRISRGDLKRLWKLASRTTPSRYPHGNVPLAKLWR